MAFWAPEGNFNLWYLPKQVSLQSQTAHDSSPTIIGNMTAKWLNLGNFLFFPNWNPRIGVWGLKCFSSFRIISVFLSNLSESAQWSEVSHSVMFDSLWPPGLYSPWNSPGQNTGVGSLSLLQGIFPTQGSGSAQYLSPIWASEFLYGVVLQLVLASVFALSMFLQRGKR